MCCGLRGVSQYELYWSRALKCWGSRAQACKQERNKNRLLPPAPLGEASKPRCASDPPPVACTPHVLSLLPRSPPCALLHDHVPVAAPSFALSTIYGGGWRAGKCHLSCGSERAGSWSTGKLQICADLARNWSHLSSCATLQGLMALQDPLRCSYERFSLKTERLQKSEAAAVEVSWQLWTTKQQLPNGLLPLQTFLPLMPISSR